MNKFILATAFAAIMPLSATTFAADTTTTTGNSASGTANAASHVKNHAAGKLVHDQMEADAARLNLTTEQRTKIAEIVKEHKKDLDEDIRDELNDTQKTEFDKIQAEHKAAWGK